MKNQSFMKRFIFAYEGVKESWKSEKSFRVHTIASIVIILILVVTKPAAIWWAVLLITCGLVMTLELINTATEKMIDHLNPDLHPTVKIIKDTLAGAVLIASIVAVAVFIAFTVAMLNQ